MYFAALPNPGVWSVTSRSLSMVFGTPIKRIGLPIFAACFESLLAQDCSDFQVIAVDDGSPDHSGEICDEYARKDSRIIVIHQKNAGVSVARNNGIKASTTEWVTFVDPDDWIDW